MPQRAKVKFRTVVPLSESARRSEPTQGGRIYRGVTLIKAGPGNRRDKNYYPPETLKAAVEAGMFEGLRAFADHPDSISDEVQPERTVRDLVGVYENQRYDEADQTVKADLRILKSHKWLSDTIDELIEMGHPDKIGLSINGSGQTEPGRRRLEESGEEEEVNEVRRFVNIRSTDIVTEAGAGGGFAQLLESARRAQENTHMGRKELLAAIREAAKAGNSKKVDELTKQLEAGDETDEGAEKGKTRRAREMGASHKGKKRPVYEAKDEDADEVDEDDEEADDLEEAVDEAKDGTDPDDFDEEDEDLEEADEDEDGDDESDDEDDEDLEEADDEEDEGERSITRAHASSAIERVRAQADRSRATKEAAIKGGTGSPTGTIKSGGGSFVKTNKHRKKGSKPPMTAKGMKGKRTTGGAQTVESGRAANLAAENARLRRQLEAANTKLAHTTESLRVRSSADRAKKLLKESNLPKNLLPTLVKDLIGLSDEDMRREIRRTEKLIEAAADHVKSDLMDDFDDVEGAGSSLRESSFGGGRGGDDVEGLFEDLGLPMKD